MEPKNNITDLVTFDPAVTVQRFQYTPEKLRTDIAKYDGLAIAGLTDKAGFTAVSEARSDLRQRRIGIERIRKDLVEDAVKFQRTVNSAAKELTAVIEPLEDKLAGMLNDYEAEKERVKQEKIEAERLRVAALAKTLLEAGCQFDGFRYFHKDMEIIADNLKAMDEETIGIFAETVKTLKAKEEADRLAKEAEEKAQQEAERAAMEAKLQAEREAAEKARQEREKVEAELRAAQEAKRKAEEEIAAMRKAEEDRVRKEAEAKLAAIRAEEEASAKAERERIAAEALREAEEKLKAKAEAERKAQEAYKAELLHFNTVIRPQLAAQLFGISEQLNATIDMLQNINNSIAVNEYAPWFKELLASVHAMTVTLEGQK